jgi:hypothetical protein
LTEDRDGVVQVFESLEHRLRSARDVVVLLADDLRRESSGGRGERIHRRIDPQFGTIGAGSVRSSAGTYTAWNDVIEPFLVGVIHSWSAEPCLALVLDVAQNCSVGHEPAARGGRDHSVRRNGAQF